MSAEAVRYVLDTDTITYHQLGRPAVVARLGQADPRTMATTVITLTEQLQGRLAAVRRQRDGVGLVRAYQLLQATHAYFCQVPVLPFDDVALVVYRGLGERRLRIGTQDLRIAAITLAHQATLVTSNRRHFDQIPELPIDDWATPV
jgi:tRNA(fMet)-specific endonuclease VapC